MLTRIIVGLLLAGVLALVLFAGGLLQCVVFSLATLISVYEMRCIFRAKGWKPFAIPSYIFAAGYYAFNHYLGTYSMLLLLVFCVGATITERVISKKRNTEDVLAGLSLYIYPLSFYILFMLASDLPSFSLGRVALLMTCAGPLMGDTVAYFIGVLWGKRKLCPHISPKKTWEGSVGGVLGGALGGVIVFFAQRIWDAKVDLISLIVLGLACGVIGQIGDLFASSLKRWAGVKDFGTIFPGHGGMMDRLDSVLMCAPVVFLYFYALYDAIAEILP